MQPAAEHFLDGLWLDNADLHSCPHGSREGNWRAHHSEQKMKGRALLV
jgi:hypothetical protein